MVDRYDIENDFAAQKEFDATQEGIILSLASQNAALEQRVKELEAELGVWENRETFWDETNKELEDELSTLRAEREELVELHQGQYSGLHADYERFRADNERLKKENDEMDSKYQDQMLDLEGRLHKHYENLRAEIEDRKNSEATIAKMLDSEIDENERLQARLTEQADEFGRQIQSLHLDVAVRDGEIKQLKDWKESSIEVENRWDAQEVARIMGLRPGADIRGNVEPYIRKINAEIERLKHWHKLADLRAAEIVRLREQLAYLPADWTTDSSLETWFPLTAEELVRLKADNLRLREALKGLYEHTKNNQQICGLNETAKVALGGGG